MRIKIIAILISLTLITGCTIVQEDRKPAISDGKAVSIQSLATYYNHGSDRATYLTKQKHTYYPVAMKMKAEAKEPSGSYQMAFNGQNISLSGKGGSEFWNLPIAKLLATAYSLGNKYHTPADLGFEQQQDTVRIKGILYKIHKNTKGSVLVRLYSRVSDGLVDRIEIEGDFGTYSAFSYNPFYEAAINMVVIHNIDIYKGSAQLADVELVYSVKYDKF